MGDFAMDDYAEFRHFKYLLALAETGGMRAAALALNTAQPSLGRQIREFQEHYGVRFYRRRKGRGIELTPAGEALKVIAKDILELREEALAALMAIHLGKAEVLRIGCTPFVPQEICHRAMELQKALVPAATLRISHGDTHKLIEQLMHDELDGAIVSLPVSNEGLRIEIIRRERLVACMPAEHPLAKKTALSAEDLTANLKVFRHPSQHPEAHEVLSELLAELGVDFEANSHFSHPHDMQQSIKSGFGFALMREGTALLEGLTARPILGVEWTFDTAFVYRNTPRSQIIPIIAKNLRKDSSTDVNRRRKKPAQGVKAHSKLGRMKLAR
jgi:DNA-binding transcriptional LysR family regulator